MPNPQSANKKKRPSKRKWGAHTINVSEENGRIVWVYDSKHGGGGYVEITSGGDWVYVSTDDYEGTAMFPSAILKEVIRALKQQAEEPHA